MLESHDFVGVNRIPNYLACEFGTKKTRNKTSRGTKSCDIVIIVCPMI